MDKSRIIEMIRMNKSVPQPFPERYKASKPETDLASIFDAVLKQVGSEIFYIETERQLPEFISSHFSDTVDFSNPGSWKAVLDSVPDIEQLDKVILQAQFGVAENGAVWLDESNFPKRIIPFIGKHLIIKLFRKDLIGGIIEAYEKYDMAKTGFGVFISGPSKTADIEQVLVFGAHGPLKHTVLLIN